MRVTQVASVLLFVLPGVWKGFIRKRTSEPGPKGTPRIREVLRRA